MRGDRHELGLPGAETPLKLCGGAGSLQGLFPKSLCCP